MEGDSGDEERDERSDCDGEEELDDILLWGVEGTTATPSGTLLLKLSSSCWDSETSFPTEREVKIVKIKLFHVFIVFMVYHIKVFSGTNKERFDDLG